jgi:3,4-dihydroxy-9,10-secoandrosta-1,3,5(10)-triene-9,17-dione 4,5-dioxygenase
MVEVEDVDDVGRALDALRRGGDAPAADLGRHPDDVLSFYAWSPDSFMIEYGTEGKQVDPDFRPGREIGDEVWGHSGLSESHKTLIGRSLASGA